MKIKPTIIDGKPRCSRTCNAENQLIDDYYCPHAKVDESRSICWPWYQAEVERLRMDVETLSQGIANREKAKQMFQSQVTMAVACLKKVYRKHAMSDESIGWDEVENHIQNTLCELMGDGNFSNWVERF